MREIVFKMERPGLVEEGVKVYGLVGEATYSSAIINAVELVDAGGVLAGSPTSGSVNHFGSTGSFTLPNSGIRVSCSSKYIDLGTLLEAGLGAQVEPLVATVRVEQTLDDYLAGRDTLVDWLLANGAEIYRVQQTMEIIARSYGARSFHVYVLTNGLFASMEDGGAVQSAA